MTETLVIGLGGVGIHACRRFLDRTAGSVPRGAGTSEPQILLLDTDRSVESLPGKRGLWLTASASVLDAAYRNPERFQAEWLNREVVRGQRSVEAGARGNRMLGRFLLLLPENRIAIRREIEGWLAATGGAGRKPDRRRVFVVASAAGGTGGGQVVDLGYLVQDVAAAHGVSVELRAILLLPPQSNLTFAPNTFATLTELHYFSDPFVRYRACLGEGDQVVESRLPPYRRVVLLTSQTVDGTILPVEALQEATAVFLMLACQADHGYWQAEQDQREGRIAAVDPDGNPQVFSTFGVAWVEYPEERLADAVYRNLVRRSLYPWLHGDFPISTKELPREAPLRDSEALVRLFIGADGTGQAPDALLRPIRTRLPWLHKAPVGQWRAVDQELEGALRQTIGKPPSGTDPGAGPMAERFAAIYAQVIGSLRAQTETWLKRDDLAFERVTRVLNEAATELRTHTDPIVAWGEAWEVTRSARRRILHVAQSTYRDPFLLFWKALALRRLALEYERTASQHAENQLRSQAAAYMRELRERLLDAVRTWAGRIGEMGAVFAGLSRSMADYEAAVLEDLRREDEAHRLALGQLRLPGAETPYVAHSSWNLPTAPPAEEAEAIRDLRQGWIESLVLRDDGLLAEPGRSIVDGVTDEVRDERLPWLLPPTFTPTLEGMEARYRNVTVRLDQELRTRMEPRLRRWLAASAYQRLAEQHESPLDLEYQLRRLIQGPGELPALDPPHSRPAGFPAEHGLVFFGETHLASLPPVLAQVVEAAARDRPLRVVPSHSARYLASLTEHAGFALSRCPAYFAVSDGFQETTRRGLDPLVHAFSRTDAPWVSATLVTHTALREAANVLFLALCWGLLRPLPSGEIPLPASMRAGRDSVTRIPLPSELDLAIRQLAGDAVALESLRTAVDRMLQARGPEWACLQLERVLRGEIPFPAVVPGADPGQRERLFRLSGLRAAARYEDLFDEFARTQTSRDLRWLRVGAIHCCPACGQELGREPEGVPGRCPRCREPLQAHLLRDPAVSDGFRRIPNPFVVGTPLEGGAPVFVGRGDIINQVRDRLIRPAQRTILILIGERRSGKTSALKQLQHRLEGDLTPIFVDMQGLTASDLSGFIWWLSWRMKEALEERGVTIQLPTFEAFSSGPPDYQFETVILPEVRRRLNGGRVLLMLDEFEVLAQRVMQGNFDSRAFDYLRHLMQHGEGIEFLFAGTHVLRQFAANYVTFLFNIGVFLQVDFLDRESALKLVQDPVAAAGVTYEPESLAVLLELAGAHAYFTQLFGFHLVERLNRVRRRNVTREDVEMVSGPVIAAAGAHLDHVWGQLTSADRLLLAFFVDHCARGEWLSEPMLVAAAVRDDSSLRPFLLRTAMDKLMSVGLLRDRQVAGEDGRLQRQFALTAEVYRQWVETQHSYHHLREEGLKWE